MIKLNRQDYTDDSYSWIVGIEQYDFPSSSFGKVWGIVNAPI